MPLNDVASIYRFIFWTHLSCTGSWGSGSYPGSYGHKTGNKPGWGANHTSSIAIKIFDHTSAVWCQHWWKFIICCLIPAMSLFLDGRAWHHRYCTQIHYIVKQNEMGLQYCRKMSLDSTDKMLPILYHSQVTSFWWKTMKCICKPHIFCITAFETVLRNVAKSSELLCYWHSVLSFFSL